MCIDFIGVSFSTHSVQLDTVHCSCCYGYMQTCRHDHIAHSVHSVRFKAIQSEKVSSEATPSEHLHHRHHFRENPTWIFIFITYSKSVPKVFTEIRRRAQYENSRRVWLTEWSQYIAYHIRHFCYDFWAKNTACYPENEIEFERRHPSTYICLTRWVLLTHIFMRKSFRF